MSSTGAAARRCSKASSECDGGVSRRGTKWIAVVTSDRNESGDVAKGRGNRKSDPALHAGA